MMIRERQGAHTSTVLLVRVSWSPERKRSVQEVLGSFPRHVADLPPELAGPSSPLTEAEQAEARAWIADRLYRDRLSGLPILGRLVTRQAADLASAIEDPATVDAAVTGMDHLALYEAVDRLTRALRRHGLTRPPRRKPAPEVPADPESLTPA